MGPSFQNEVDEAGRVLKTKGFRCDARVYMMGSWGGGCYWFGLRSERIIREADVKNTVDLPWRNWLLWAAGHWYSSAGRTGYSGFEGQQQGGERLVEDVERIGASYDEEKEKGARKKLGIGKRRKLGISPVVLSSSPVTPDSNSQKTKCCKCGYILLCALNIKDSHTLKWGTGEVESGELTWQVLVGF